MNDAFRITVHWSERIVEIRFPRNPTVASFARCHEEVVLAVARIRKPWMALIDDTAVEEIQVGLLEAVTASAEWCLRNGLSRTAAVSRLDGAIDRRIRLLADRSQFPQGIGLRFATREDAWAALMRPGTTPAEGMRAFSATIG